MRTLYKHVGDCHLQFCTNIYIGSRFFLTYQRYILYMTIMHLLSVFCNTTLNKDENKVYLPVYFIKIFTIRHIILLTHGFPKSISLQILQSQKLSMVKIKYCYIKIVIGNSIPSFNVIHTHYNLIGQIKKEN